MTINLTRVGKAITAVAVAATVALSSTSTAQAANFSSTKFKILHGDGFRLGRNGRNETSRSTFRVGHFSTYDYGDNFFFFNSYVDGDGTGREGDIYGEAFTHLSLSKFSGKSLDFGFVKDVALGAGINHGTDFSVGLLGAI